MVELLIVLMLVAMASGLAGLALRDTSEARLDREAVRLSALLEAARAESRASGLAVRFELSSASNASGEAFRFSGLPVGVLPAGRWLEPAMQAQIVGARAVVLGPEPIIGAQRVVLWLDGRQRTLVTDGLAPFTVMNGGNTTP